MGISSSATSDASLVCGGTPLSAIGAASVADANETRLIGCLANVVGVEKAPVPEIRTAARAAIDAADNETRILSSDDEQGGLESNGEVMGGDYVVAVSFAAFSSQAEIGNFNLRKARRTLFHAARHEDAKACRRGAKRATVVFSDAPAPRDMLLSACLLLREEISASVA